MATKENAREVEQDWAPAFCEQIAMGKEVKVAAEAAGVSRQYPYERRAKDPVFAAGWQAALEMRQDRLMALMYERATVGTVTHEEWEYDAKGERRLIAQTRRVSDTLAIFEMKKLDPSYRDRVQVDQSVSGTVNHVHQVSFLPEGQNPDNLSLEDRRRAAAAALGLELPEVVDAEEVE